MVLSAPARAAPFSAEQRAETERILRREVETGVVPGICWSIGTASETLADGAVGLRTVSPDTPMRVSTRVALASTSKQFTAGAIYLLHERGVISLDAPLARYLPSYRYAANITLRQMLTMSSGISADTEACEAPVDGRLDEAALLQRLDAMDLISRPGEHFSYSNCAYDLAGAVITKMSGLPFASFVDEEIFKPLRMADSYGAATRQVPDPDFAEGYAAEGTGWEPRSMTPGDKFFASGNLVSTAADMQRWNRALLNATLLSRKSLQEMFSVPALTSGARTIYASGWFVEPGGLIWHGGALDGYGTANVLVPATGHAITLLGNTEPGKRWKPWEVAREIYDATGLGPMLPPFTPIIRTTLPDK